MNRSQVSQACVKLAHALVSELMSTAVRIDYATISDAIDEDLAYAGEPYSHSCDGIPPLPLPELQQGQLHMYYYEPFVDGEMRVIYALSPTPEQERRMYRLCRTAWLASLPYRFFVLKRKPHLIIDWYSK